VLAQVTAPHFCAGVVLTNDVVTEAAPILRYMVGWSRDRVRDYASGKGWQVKVVNVNNPKRMVYGQQNVCIGVAHGLRGYFAVEIVDGFPSASGVGSFETYEEAAEEAESWAMAEGVKAVVNR